MKKTIIDQYIKAPINKVNGAEVDFLRENASKKLENTYNSKINIIEFSNGVKSL